MKRYQWTVLLVAWLGWGFDVFAMLLFNYVAPNCVPTLLGLPIGSPEAKSATLFWTGLMTSILLIGWAMGGVAFGPIADRIGRTKTLLITMNIYALGTAAGALAPNIWVLALLRWVASLGIGGEWAAGAAMVAEVVPEKWRIESGALLYTAAPAGLFLATYINWQISGVWLTAQPEIAWRYVFLCALLPAIATLFIRHCISEPERWQQAVSQTSPARIPELFTPKLLPATRSGWLMAMVVVLTVWSCSAFTPIVATGLAQVAAQAQNLDRTATLSLVEDWKALANNYFNWGGLVGALLTAPIAKYIGRKFLFQAYFTLSIVSLLATFGMDLPPQLRLALYFPVGVGTFGIFASFGYYLTELFPTRLRTTGAGFCYNAGRVIAAVGPFAVGAIAAQGANALQSALATLTWVSVLPFLGLCCMPWVIETKAQGLKD
ncbi:MAG: MFS transporter [Cyanobacteria bacterium P01_H01_bin.21]